MNIKFLTLNILHGGRFWDNLIEFIHKEDPDIAVFQEVYDGHDESLEKKLRTMDEFRKEFTKLKYSAFTPSFLEESINVDEGNAIFSKFPIRDVRYHPFNSEYKKYNALVGNDFRDVPGGMIEGQISLNGKEIFVYNMHGAWDTHGDDTPARDKMADVVIDAIGSKENVIISGDTNLYYNTNFTRRLEHELGLVSVFKDSLTSTFNMKYKDEYGYATAAVDMIFASKNFKVKEKYMPLDNVSDHRPLVAFFEI